VNEMIRNEVIRRWRGGATMRAIARALGVSRNTVSRIVGQVDQTRAGQESETPARRASLLDPYESIIQDLLGRYPDLTGVRLLEELRGRGFTGNYTIVRRRLQALRPRTPQQPVRRFETGPGAQAQMDYATYDLDFSEVGRRRVHLFSYVLGYSRRQYLRFVESQDMATTLQQHVRAFEHLGGVAATCLYDNMKVVVSGYDGDVPMYNPRFLAFATHYGYRPVACRPRRPQTKGKVERPFHYVETNLLCGRDFRDMEHLNEVTAWWLAEVADERIHRETRQSPRARHAEEVRHLIPLPAAPYEVATMLYRSVTVEGCVAIQQNHYSVPWRYLGQLLPVRVTELEVIIYGPQLEEVARHRLLPRSARNQRSEQAQHRPVADQRQRQADLQERFDQLGTTAGRFLEGLMQNQRYGRDQAERVLALLGTYRRADVLAALERAVRYGAYSVAAVERILAAQARPRSVLETLAEQSGRSLPGPLEGPSTSARPTAEYQPLLPREPEDGKAADTGESPDSGLA
jgi:transposase